MRELMRINAQRRRLPTVVMVTVGLNPVEELQYSLPDHYSPPGNFMY